MEGEALQQLVREELGPRKSAARSDFRRGKGGGSEERGRQVADSLHRLAAERPPVHHRGEVSVDVAHTGGGVLSARLDDLSGVNLRLVSPLTSVEEAR